QRFQREIESIAGHLQEIGVAALQSAQPGVLQLLVAPQDGEPFRVVTEHVSAPRRGGGKVEQRAVGVENAGADPVQLLASHRVLPARCTWDTAPPASATADDRVTRCRRRAKTAPVQTVVAAT